MSAPHDGGGASLRVSDVWVRYPGSDRPALQAADLEVAGGELIVLLGPSGCGKSTFLRTMNRLIEPERGTIEIDGRDVRAVSPEVLRRGIGYVIQAVGLFPHLTVGQNVAVVPELLGWDRARIAARVDELLELVRLEPRRYRNRLPAALSGGEQQRVGVARALAAEPRLLLMDEPFGAVDAIVRLALQDEVLRLHRVLGTTIVFVTHDVDEALRLGDRLVVMQAGRILQAATPLQALVHPASPPVAELLDAGDAVRRLQLLGVRDALRPLDATRSVPAGDFTPIAADCTLRDALSLLLDGPTQLVVRDGQQTLGVLDFDDIRRAVTAGA